MKIRLYSVQKIEKKNNRKKQIEKIRFSSEIVPTLGDVAGKSMKERAALVKDKWNAVPEAVYRNYLNIYTHCFSIFSQLRGRCFPIFSVCTPGIITVTPLAGII